MIIHGPSFTLMSISASKLHNPEQIVMSLDHDVHNRTENNLQKYRQIKDFVTYHGVDIYLEAEVSAPRSWLRKVCSGAPMAKVTESRQEDRMLQASEAFAKVTGQLDSQAADGERKFDLAEAESKPTEDINDGTTEVYPGFPGRLFGVSGLACVGGRGEVTTRRFHTTAQEPTL